MQKTNTTSLVKGLLITLGASLLCAICFQIIHTDDTLLISNTIAVIVSVGVGLSVFLILFRDRKHNWIQTIGLATLFILLVLVIDSALLSVFSNILGPTNVGVGISFALSLSIVWCFYGLHYSLQNKSKSIKRAALIILSSIFLLTLLSILHSSWNIALNPDGISYYSVAEHYAAGHFKEAVNAYWSPFISWVLVPFIWLGLDTNSAFRICTGLIVILILVGQYLLLRKHFVTRDKSYIYQIGHYISLAITASFLLMVIQGGSITPDLASVAWVVWFALLALGVMHKALANYTVSRASIVMLGMMGALGFYIKGFLFPFFIVAIIILMVLLLLNDPNKKKAIYLRDGILVVAVTGLLMMPWILLLHQKYERWMTGSSNRYNISWVGPDSIKHPINRGPLPPSNQYAVFAWEDPTDHPYRKWSPTESLEATQYHLFSNIPNTVKAILRALIGWSPVVPALMISGIAIALFSNYYKKRKDNRKTINSLILLNAFSLTYIAGYAAIHLVGGERYIWPVLLLSIITAALIGIYLYKNFLDAGNKRWIFTGAIGVIIVMFFALYLNPNFVSKFNIADRPTYVSLANELRGVLPKGSRILGNGINPGYQLAYLLDLKTYGAMKNLDYRDDKTKQKLKELKIDYFLCKNLVGKCGFSDDMLVWKFNENSASKVLIYKVSD